MIVANDIEVAVGPPYLTELRLARKRIQRKEKERQMEQT